MIIGGAVFLYARCLLVVNK